MLKKMICLLLVLLFIPSLVTFSEVVYSFGDVDGNGQIAAPDALLALQHSVQKITLSSAQQTAADVDLNGSVTAGDALMILQHAVGKIVLTPPSVIDYDDYELKYVEPVGFTAGNIYRIAASSTFLDKNGKSHDYTRLAVCVQGLVNRNFDKHNVAIALKLDSTDDFWLSYIRGEGKTYDNLTPVNISSPEAMFNAFVPFLQEYGIVLWDTAVPSTANVAATICGLYNYIPVPFDTSEGSLYRILTDDYDVPVKMNLVGMFEDAKKGGKIAGTNLESTGSAKCDAYVWAMENYMKECNPEFLAYTLDGAPSVAGNPVSNMGDAPYADRCGIPNHDYFIYRQCFFFDLTSYGGEAPSDDPTQTLGTDSATLEKLLKKRYDLVGGQFGIILGFPPWHLKYTRYVDPSYHMDPPRLEWHFVEFSTSFNMGIEADAAHPAWMSNGSLYTNYTRVNEPKGNARAKDMVYDPDTYYFTISHTGDFDCSPWMKFRVPTVWANSERGNVIMSYSYNANLVERIPMAFDYIFEKQTENEYVLNHSGVSYIIPNALFKGFVGKEADPVISGPSGFYGPNRDWVVYRTLPDGAEAYYNYAKPYYDMLKTDVLGFLLCGFSVITPETMALYNRLNPGGVFIQSSTAGEYDVRLYEGQPYVKNYVIRGDTMEDRTVNLRTMLRASQTKFAAFVYNNIGINYATASEVKTFTEAFAEYVSWRDPSSKHEYVDVYTFMSLLKQSGKGFVMEKD